MSEKPYTPSGILEEIRYCKLLIMSEKCRLRPFEIQILKASWKTGNNYFEDFYAFFSPISDAKPGLEVVENRGHPYNDGSDPGFRGSSRFPVAKSLCSISPGLPENPPN